MSGKYVAFRYADDRESEWFWSSRWHIVDSPAGLIALPHDDAIKLTLAEDWPGMIFSVTFANQSEAEHMITSINAYVRRRGAK